MNFSDERTAWQLAINMWCLGLKLISNNQINPLMTAKQPTIIQQYADWYTGR